MENYIDIPTPYRGIITRKKVASSTFRPSATGIDNDELAFRFQMESLEVEASIHQREGYISVAAHPDTISAEQAALDEADERISAASWWVYDRPVLSCLDISNTLPEMVNVNKSEINSVNIGLIESYSKRGHVAISILQGSCYPFAVFGSAISHNPNISGHKAFMESVQSWTASKWLQQHDTKKAPPWDVEELIKRSTLIKTSSPVITRQDQSTPIDTYKIETQQYANNTVAWVYSHDGPVSGTSLSLAAIAQKPGETAQVFTNHNF